MFGKEKHRQIQTFEVGDVGEFVSAITCDIGLTVGNKVGSWPAYHILADI